MKVKLRLFALYRELLGKSEMTLELPAGADVAALRHLVERDYPRLQGHDIVISVNGLFADPDRKLADGDEVALLPPFSGGSASPFRESSTDRIELTHKPISPEAVTAKVLKDKHGAVVTFLGTVRDHSEGKAVRYLEYEAYPEMAIKMLKELVDEVRQKWGIEDVAITHRLGRMDIGEVSVVIAVASPHRKEAFEACQYAIDRLKETVPIWKKEVFEDGERWVAGEHGND